MKVFNKWLMILVAGLGAGVAAAQTNSAPALKLPPIAAGPFKPDWDSLTSQYQTPEWFRDAKFGIWAHWGPQCQPEEGDWYARNMYIPGQPSYKLHLAEYGHPSTNGFKDVIHEWKAENFDPDKLLAFYKKNGAKYFMALGAHHDNFDNFNSKYQPWNSVAVGPHKDLIGGWARAARKNGLRFAVSIHSSHAWSWYEVAQGADKDGPFAGVPYDGKLTKADGKGLWWDGLDPQELYAQNHTPGEKLVWGWDPAKGSSVPDAAYMEKFFNRVKQLYDDYSPDMMYFDDSVLPLHGVTDDIGLNLAAHFYNSSVQKHGHNEAVMNAKDLNDNQRKAMTYDIERGKADHILPQPWQTDTCIGSWHYKLERFEKHQYVPATTIIPMLADIVSKNGNLMLSVPLQRDGQPDSDEIKIVSDIGAWLKVNGDAIYATRPWKTYGEGPSTLERAGGRPGRQSIDKSDFSPEDVRFTQSKDGKKLYAIFLALPISGTVTVKSLAAGSSNWTGDIGSVRMLGVSGKLKFTRDENGLHVTLPDKLPCQTAFALQIRS
jgi:alpha-L-fucosidase